MSTIVTDLGKYLQAGATIAARDAVYIDSTTGKIQKFDPTNPALVYAGIAKEDGVLDDYIFVVQSGRVKGFTELTAGAFVYASTTVPGGFQLVEPIASQKVVLGIADSSTEITLNGGLGIKPGGEGGAGGGLDSYYTEDMEGLADTSSFSTGNNATFLGAGTFQGTLALEEASPISGVKSLKYTQAAGSLNDWFASELIDLDRKQRDETSGTTLYFTYDGNDDDMKFVVWDVTNSRELSNQVSFVKIANQPTRYSLSFYVPQSTTQIRWGAQVLVENSGKILVIDDVEMSTNPFVSAELFAEVSSIRVDTANGYGSSATRIRRFSNVRDNIGNDIIYTDSGTDGASFTIRTSGIYSISYSATTDSGTVAAYISKNATGNELSTDASTLVDNTPEKILSNEINAVSEDASSSWEGFLEAGDVIRPHTNAGANSTRAKRERFTITKIGKNSEHVLTPSDTFSTDTAPLKYAGSSQYTLSTLAKAPIGTFITFTYDINSNTRTQTDAAPPTQTTSDMNQNGMRIFTRAYNAASTAGEPAAIAVQIGKGLKAADLKLYKNVGKDIQGSPDRSVSSTDSVGYGARIKDYNELTGILIFDSGWQETTITGATFLFSDLTSQNNGYLTINAGRTLPLLAVPVPLVAYLKDVKPSGTAGGTFTAGAWQTRTLNTVEGDGSIVSLSANQFTLGPGRYEIEASAPARLVDKHAAKLRNITDSSDAIIGTAEYSVGVSNADLTRSFVSGVITLSSAKVFEIQHRCTTTRETDGFGAAATLGVSEIYAQVKIVKKA